MTEDIRIGTSYLLCAVFFQLYELVSVFVDSVLGFQGIFLVELIPVDIHDGIKFHQESSRWP